MREIFFIKLFKNIQEKEVIVLKSKQKIFFRGELIKLKELGKITFNFDKKYF